MKARLNHVRLRTSCTCFASSPISRVLINATFIVLLFPVLHRLCNHSRPIIPSYTPHLFHHLSTSQSREVHSNSRDYPFRPIAPLPASTLHNNALRDPKTIADKSRDCPTELPHRTRYTPAPLPLCLIVAVIKPLEKPRPVAPRERNPPLGGGGTNPLVLPIPLPTPTPAPPPLPSPLTLPLPRQPRTGEVLSETATASCSMAFGSPTSIFPSTSLSLPLLSTAVRW